MFVRSPLRLSTLDLINFSVPIPAESGCVIVICHTPWKRILVQWCLEKKFALVVSRGEWMHRKKHIQRQAVGFTELRNIVRHLQQKGKVILTADNFNGFTNCPVRFLEHSRNCSTIHVRLAILAKVPIIVMMPTLNNTSIDFIKGPQFNVDHLSVDVPKSTQGILAFMEKQIEADPSLWSCYTN